MKKILVLLGLGFLVCTGNAWAQESNQTEKLETLVKDQNRIISELLQRIEALETTQDEQSDWLAEQDHKEVWTDRVKIKGDFRYRYEWIDDDRKDDDRNRNRIRARIGLKAKANDDVDLGFQLSTGGAEGYSSEEGDPLSGNSTLTNGFSLKHIWLSRAYANWHPHQVPGLNVTAGKMAAPFYNVGKSELVWDGDLNPEGIAVKYKKSFDSLEAFGGAYGFWVLERKAEGDSGLFGVQGGLKKKFTAFDDKAHVLGGLSYYDFGNIQGEAPFFNADGDDFGNSLDGAGALAEDFDLFETFGEFGFRVKKVPVTLFADYVTNTAASSDNDGWSVGFKVGKAKKPGSWQFRYLYKEVEKDAVVGGFTDSDFGGGGTDVEGHEINVAYQIAKNWQVALSYFNNDTGISGDEEDYERVQVDLKFKF